MWIGIDSICHQSVKQWVREGVPRECLNFRHFVLEQSTFFNGEFLIHNKIVKSLFELQVIIKNKNL